MAAAASAPPSTADVVVSLTIGCIQFASCLERTAANSRLCKMSAAA
jgi:hypothetical protein